MLHTYEGMPWLSAASPHALIYGAKEMGFERVVEILPLYAVNRLLTPGDILFPHDMVDMTRHHPTTFFVGKGYGFLHHTPPFCPTLRRILLETAQAVANTIPIPSRPRVFKRGTWGIVDTPHPCDTPIVQRMRQWGIDATSTATMPVNFLARELELCYVPAGSIIDPLDHPIHPVTGEKPVHLPAETLSLLAHVLAEAQEELAPERTCLCATSMQQARAQGQVQDDWHTWISK